MIRFLPALMLLAACQLSLPGNAPHSPASLPPIGPECTGPGAGNFNDAPLTPALIASIPRQFAADRAALQAVLDGRADAQTRRFARLCHGVKLPE